MDEEQIQLFRAIRSLNALKIFALTILEDLCAEHNAQIERVGESLSDMEFHIYEKTKQDFDLAHLTKHFAFLDDKKYASLRKKLFDYAGNLERSLKS